MAVVILLYFSTKQKLIVILLNDRVNMKQIALIILLFVCLTINGQQINYSSNHYRSSDMLECLAPTEKNLRAHGGRNNDERTALYPSIAKSYSLLPDFRA